MQGTPRQDGIMRPLADARPGGKRVSTRLYNRTYEAVGKLDDHTAKALVDAIIAELEERV